MGGLCVQKGENENSLSLLLEKYNLCLWHLDNLYSFFLPRRIFFFFFLLNQVGKLWENEKNYQVELILYQIIQEDNLDQEHKRYKFFFIFLEGKMYYIILSRLGEIQENGVQQVTIQMDKKQNAQMIMLLLCKAPMTNPQLNHRHRNKLMHQDEKKVPNLVPFLGSHCQEKDFIFAMMFPTSVDPLENAIVSSRPKTPTGNVPKKVFYLPRLDTPSIKAKL